MSWFDDMMSNTAGVVWRAASGTVDPWTKNQLVENQADAIVQASNGSITQADATQQAQGDVTQSLLSFGDGQGADPSQVLDGVKRSLGTAGNIGFSIGKTILYAGIGVALIYAVYVAFQLDLPKMLRKLGRRK